MGGLCCRPKMKHSCSMQLSKNDLAAIMLRDIDAIAERYNEVRPEMARSANGDEWYKTDDVRHMDKMLLQLEFEPNAIKPFIRERTSTALRR